MPMPTNANGSTNHGDNDNPKNDSCKEPPPSSPWHSSPSLWNTWLPIWIWSPLPAHAWAEPSWALRTHRQHASLLYSSTDQLPKHLWGWSKCTVEAHIPYAWIFKVKIQANELFSQRGFVLLLWQLCVYRDSTEHSINGGHYMIEVWPRSEIIEFGYLDVCFDICCWANSVGITNNLTPYLIY